MAWVSPDERVFLDGLQVGEMVVVGGWRDWKVLPVERLTAARAWVGGSEYDRKTGVKRGASSDFYRAQIAALTPARVDEARKELEQRKEEQRRKAVRARLATAIETAPTALLESVADALEAATCNCGFSSALRLAGRLP